MFDIPRRERACPFRNAIVPATQKNRPSMVDQTMNGRRSALRALRVRFRLLCRRNLLIEREGGAWPPSHFPRCSIPTLPSSSPPATQKNRPSMVDQTMNGRFFR